MVKPRKKAAKKVASPRKGASPPFAEYPAWTEAAFFSYLRGHFRKSFQRWPPKWQVIAQAKRDYHGPNSKQKYEYQCAECKNWYPKTETEVDHITSCGSLKAFSDAGDFLQRMFVSAQKLRLLCKICHRSITTANRESKKNEPGMDSK